MIEIDAKGLKCPEPLMLLHKAIYEAESGEEVRLISTDPMSVPDVKKFCEYLEHKLKEIKESDNGKYNFVEFSTVETDRKGGKYRIISCIPKKEPKDSIIKTIKTNYKLNP